MNKVKQAILSNDRITESISLNIASVTYYLARYIAQAKKVGCNLTTPSQLACLKTSDTLFVLGAGSSLNDLSRQDWGEIEACNVAGTTSTCLLPVRQTYYFFEASRNEQILKNWYPSVYAEAMHKLRGQKIRVALWKNPGATQVLNHLDMASFTVPLFTDLLANTEAGLRRVLRLFMKPMFANRFLVQKRASVFCLAWLGVALRYRRVVFCGVDMTNSRYFYEEGEFAERYQIYNVFTDNLAPHKTVDAQLGMPLDIALASLVAESPFTEFYTSSEESRLAEFLPVWRFRS